MQLAYASPSTVSREEVERFRQEILERSGVRDYAIVTILAYAGLRISECLALRWRTYPAAREIRRAAWQRGQDAGGVLRG